MSTYNPYRIYGTETGRVSSNNPIEVEKKPINLFSKVSEENILVETNPKFLRWFHKNAQQLMNPIVYNLLCNEFENLNPGVTLKRF